MKNPFGADGLFTKIGEHIPGVNKGIQALHERAGQTEALERARRRDPVGANGVLTQVGEKIPVVNNGIQMLHRRAGKEEALERAKAENPLGADGYVTKAAEYVPVVNLGVQELHRNADQQDALSRARERNPLGAHGYLTQIGEQMPIVNDGIAVLHWMAGQTEAEERAKGKSLQTLVSKDGAITKVAEMVPGLNLVAAALQEASGNHAEARRALDLLRNWEEAGSPNGALAKVAELVPGTDIIAFALHVNAGQYPQALRSITHTAWVRVRAEYFVLHAHCRSVRELQFSNVLATDVAITPKGLSVHGAVLDLAMNYLDVDKNGKRRPRRTHGKSLESIERNLTESGNGVVCSCIERMPQYVDVALVVANSILERKRQESALLRWALPEALPRPNDTLIKALQDAVPSVGLLHAPLRRPVEAKSRAPPRKEGDAYGLPESMAMASCFSFLGCFGLGYPTGGYACLAGIVGVAAQVRRVVAQRAAPLVNASNACAWAAVTGLGAGDVAPYGVVAELARPDVEKLTDLIRKYLLEQVLGGRWSGCLLSALEPTLRAWLSGLTYTEAQDSTLPLVIDAVVPEQVVQNCGGPSLHLQLPELRFAVLLDVNTAGSGPLLRRVRCAATDACVSHAIDQVREQVNGWDLRKADPRLQGFTEAVHANFGFKTEWVKDDQLQVTVSGLIIKLRLPS